MFSTLKDNIKRLSFLLGIFLLAFLAVLLVRWLVTPSNNDDKTSASGGFTLADRAPIEPSEIPLLTQLNQEYATVTDKVVRSVVSLDTVGRIYRREALPGTRSGVRDSRVRGLGSGVVVSKEGHIITNNHVIEGKQLIRVTLFDGRSFLAKKIGEDKVMDLAVLKIDLDEELTPLAFGNSDQVKVGQIVFAVGNPFGLGETVTQGIISAKQRSFGDLQSELLQTDAAINPGNSGGPLVNIRGEIIGINAAIYSNDKQTARSQGVGFSIPSNLVKNVFEQICEYGKPIRGYIGLSLADLSPQIRRLLKYDAPIGVAVNELHENSPATQAGLEIGDIILKYNGKEVDNARELLKMIHESEIGKTVEILLWRRNKILPPVSLTVTEAGVPAENITPVKEGIEKMERILGMGLRNLTLDEYAAGARGVLVQTLTPNTQAAAALRQGDLIVAVDNVPIDNLEQLDQHLSKGLVTLTIVGPRAGRLYTMFPRVNLFESAPASPDSSHNPPPLPPPPGRNGQD